MPETTKVSVTNVPVDALEFLRPFAIRDGQSDSDAAVMRWAVVEQEKHLRAQGGVRAAEQQQAVA